MLVAYKVINYHQNQQLGTNANNPQNCGFTANRNSQNLHTAEDEQQYYKYL